MGNSKGAYQFHMARMHLHITISFHNHHQNPMARHRVDDDDEFSFSLSPFLFCHFSFPKYRCHLCLAILFMDNWRPKEACMHVCMPLYGVCWVLTLGQVKAYQLLLSLVSNCQPICFFRLFRNIQDY